MGRIVSFALKEFHADAQRVDSILEDWTNRLPSFRRASSHILRFRKPSTQTGGGSLYVLKALKGIGWVMSLFVESEKYVVRLRTWTCVNSSIRLLEVRF
jgi:hypothetical protein